VSSILQKLETNRTPILLAEIGGWLHLLGKLSEEFIQAQSQQGGNFGYRQLCDNNPLGLEANFYGLITDNWVQTIFNSLNNAINGIPQSNTSPESLCRFSQHHLKRYINQFHNVAILKILTAAHDVSGSEEKDLPWQQNDTKQKKKHPDKNNTYSASAFGIERDPILAKNNLGNTRNSLAAKLTPIIEHIKQNYSSLNEEWWTEKYPEIIACFNEFYKISVGDTQRPVNDVTLWDAAFLASALVKSALSKMILEGWSEPIDVNTRQTVIHWKILRINLDFLSLMAKSIKVGDILGYHKSIDDSISECKQIIEIKYCLGNEIYRDNSGIYFSFPDVDHSHFWNDLQSDLKEAIQKIEPELSPYIRLSHSIPDLKDLTSQKNEAQKDIMYIFKGETISPTIADLWSSRPSNSEVCPICRLRPMKENSDGCKHCLEQRKGRTKDWVKNSQCTIWLDEVSDHNDRVALLVGAFDLTNWLNGKLIPTFSKKTPSSGRVRRCWDTTQGFINFTVFEDILKKHSYGSDSPFKELRTRRIQLTITPNPNISRSATCDVDIDGIRLSPVCIDNNQNLFITTANLQILSNKGKTVNEIASWMQEKNIKIKKEDTNKWQEGFKISSAKPANSEFQDFLPYVKIYDYPDQFMALVPAYDALDIAKKILEKYEIQFSKARDRLPFHLGIIAFHKRTPLYVAMDAGKRLIKAFRSATTTINASVASVTDTQRSRLGNYVKQLTLQPDPCYSSVPLIWNISYSTGDPNQQDEWHPYIRFKSGNPGRGDYSFDYTGNGNYVVHVKGLRINDCIHIESSYFKLIYLDSAADRFRIGEKLRPIDDIRRLDKLWEDIENVLKTKKLGTTQLYAFWQEVTKRYEDYKGDSVWEDFVKSSITNILKVSAQKETDLFNKLFQATKDGLFSLCLHWNLRVRKIKPEKTGG